MARLDRLTRKQESLLIALTTRGGRKRSECCRCEGVRAVRELLTRRSDLVLFVLGTERGFAALEMPEPPESVQLPEAEFARYCATVNTQGILAVARVPEEQTLPPQGDFILAMDGVNDPGNFGTMARTFRAIGGRTLWYTAGGVSPWGDKALRSGLGAQFALELRSFPDLETLKREASGAGYDRFFIADPHEGENCFSCGELYSHSVLVIGGEANGVSCFPDGARHVMIPMPGEYESLNAAQAATVLLLEYVRRSQNRQGALS